MNTMNFVFHMFATTSGTSKKTFLETAFREVRPLYDSLSVAYSLRLVAERHKAVHKPNLRMLDTVKEHYLHLKNLSEIILN